MPVFPKNNLPIDSLNWGREVEKSINNLETTFRSAEVNNVTRDAQLQNSYKRLDTTVNQVSLAAAQANAAAIAAQDAVDAVEDIVNNIYVDGTETIDGAVLATNTINGAKVVDGTLPGGKIQANTITSNEINTNYVYAGQINAGQINAGYIQGLTFATGSSGTRVEATSSNITFYGPSGVGGSISGNYLNGNAVNISSNGYLVLNGNNIANGGLSVTGGGLTANEGSISTQSLTTSGNITATSGTVTGTNLTATNTVSGTNVNAGTLTVTGNSDLQGRIISAGTYNAVASSTANVLINSSNFFQRTTSSRRYKCDIQDMDYGMIGLDLRPRTWVDKSAYEQNGNSADGLTRITGFIAEEIHDLGLTELVQYNEDGLPEAVNYDRMMVAVIPILKQQQQLIEQLTARIEALEA